MNYDTTGFATSYLCLIFILPITLYVFYDTLIKKSEKQNFDCSCDQCQKMKSDTSTGKNIILKEYSFKRYFLLPMLLILTSILVKNIFTLKHKSNSAFFNPFDTLNLPADASKKEIKSRYKKFSVKYDPDRVKNNENKRTIYENKLKEISRAYNQIMLGKTIHEKYEEIIAIPLLLLNDLKYRFLIILLYVFLFILLIMKMYTIYKEYNHKNRLGIRYDTMDGLFTAVTSYFFIRNTNIEQSKPKLPKSNISNQNNLPFMMTEGENLLELTDMLNLICDSHELREYSWKQPFDILKLQKIKQYVELQYAIPFNRNDMAYALLMIHLLRITDIEHTEFNLKENNEQVTDLSSDLKPSGDLLFNLDDMSYVLKTSQKLSNCLIELADATKNVNFLKKAINLKRCLLQAVINLRYVSMQLPYIKYYDIFTMIHLSNTNKSNSSLNHKKTGVKFLETDFSNILQQKKFDSELNQKLSLQFYDQLPEKKIQIEPLKANEDIQRVTVTLIDDKLVKKNGLSSEKKKNQQNSVELENEDHVNEMSTVLLREEGNSDLVNLLNNTGKFIQTPVHMPYYFKNVNDHSDLSRLTYKFLILTNGNLSKLVKLNGDFVKKEIILDFKLDKNDQLKFILICDQYFGCDTILDMRVG